MRQQREYMIKSIRETLDTAVDTFDEALDIENYNRVSLSLENPEGIRKTFAVKLMTYEERKISDKKMKKSKYAK